MYVCMYGISLFFLFKSVSSAAGAGFAGWRTRVNLPSLCIKERIGFFFFFFFFSLNDPLCIHACMHIYIHTHMFVCYIVCSLVRAMSGSDVTCFFPAG